MSLDLRPRGVGEILDAAVAILRARFGALVLLTAIVIVPVQVLSVVVVMSTQPDDVEQSITGLSPTYDETPTSELWLQLAGSVVVAVASLLSMFLATAAVTNLAANTYLDENSDRAGVRASLRPLRNRVLAVSGLSLVLALSVFAGLGACFIPGIWLAVTWSVAVPALLIEGRGVFASLGRSFNLTKIRWWTSLAVVVVGLLLTTTVSTAFTIPLQWLLGVLGSGVGASIVAGAIASTIANAVTTPVLSVALVVLYFDLRVRAEGFDVQMLVHRLGNTAAPERA